MCVSVCLCATAVDRRKAKKKKKTRATITTKWQVMSEKEKQKVLWGGGWWWAGKNGSNGDFLSPPLWQPVRFSRYPPTPPPPPPAFTRLRSCARDSLRLAFTLRFFFSLHSFIKIQVVKKRAKSQKGSDFIYLFMPICRRFAVMGCSSCFRCFCLKSWKRFNNCCFYKFI